MTNRWLRTLISMILMMVLLAGCGQSVQLSGEAQKLWGDWAYIHDRDTEIISFRKNGTAVYEDQKYTYESDGQFITLTDRQGQEQKIRYVLDDEGMLFYKNTQYEAVGEAEPQGIIGQWKTTDNLSFEFSGEGTFLEDGYFPGQYIQDETAQTIKLVYTDHFEDTLCYYRLDGHTMYMEYPWRMVPKGSKSEE